MSDTYTKLFSSITESTIWSEPAATRLVWITFLAKCNKHGEVFGSVPGVARLANVSMDEAQAAIATLLAPDKWSRTPDNEGRRIESIDGGWRILNHAKFDAIRNAEERAEYKRKWDRQNRGARPNANSRTPDKPPTTPDQTPTHPTPPALTPALQIKSKRKEQPPQAVAVTFRPPDWIDPTAWDGYLGMRKRKRAPPTDHALSLVVAELEKLRRQGHDPTAVLDQSTRSAWTDVYPLKPTGHRNGTDQQSRKLSAVEQVEQAIADRKRGESRIVEGQVVRESAGQLLAPDGGDVRPYVDQPIRSQA